MEKDLLPIGRLARVHGIQGKIKVRYYGEDPKQFSFYRKVILEDETGTVRTYEVLKSVSQPPYIILQLKGIERIEDAKPLVGKEVFVRREFLPGLEKDEYYWVDILGMVVETEEGKRIGRVKEIIPTEANDVYVVEGTRGEIFLPAVKEIIMSVDLQKRVIGAHRMEGLWEVEDEV